MPWLSAGHHVSEYEDEDKQTRHIRPRARDGGLFVEQPNKYTEDMFFRPFVGKSGDLLSKIREFLGRKDKDFQLYIAD